MYLITQYIKCFCFFIHFFLLYFYFYSIYVYDCLFSFSHASYLFMYYFSLILCAIVWMLRNLNFIRNTVYFPYEWIDKCEAFAILSWLTIKIEQTWSSFSDELTSHNSCIIVCKLIKSNNSFHWWFFEGEKKQKNFDWLIVVAL